MLHLDGGVFEEARVDDIGSFEYVRWEAGVGAALRRHSRQCGFGGPVAVHFHVQLVVNTHAIFVAAECVRVHDAKDFAGFLQILMKGPREKTFSYGSDKTLFMMTTI